ncbi:GNA1162 family protein [Aliidiomarina sp. Khilg15.8]
MAWRPLLTALLAMFVLSACSSTQRVDDHPRFMDTRTRSVLILPPANQTTSAVAAEHYLTSLPVPLTRAGYYVLPTPVTMQIMQAEGIVDGAQLDTVDPTRFAHLFGVDLILKTTIHNWDTSYFVIGGAVVVGASFELISAHSGEVLWTHRDRRTSDTTSRNNTSLLGQLLETALNTVQQDYMPLARELNQAAFQQLPYGVYHPRYRPLVDTTPVE